MTIISATHFISRCILVSQCFCNRDRDGLLAFISSKFPLSLHDYFFQVMLLFGKYMNETLIRGGDLEHLTDVPNLSEGYMLSWVKTKQSIVMCLSTGNVQVRLKGQIFFYFKGVNSGDGHTAHYNI